MKKLYGLVGLFVVISITLSACGPTTTPTPQVVIQTVEVPKTVVETVQVPVETIITATPPPAEPVTIRFATLSGPEFTDGYQPIVDQWNAAHPEIQVQYETYPFGDYWAKIPAQFAAGNPPDILWVSTGEVDTTWVNRGVFAPLNEFITGTAPLDNADWDPLAWDYGSFNGSVYLLNTIINIPAFAYNKDLFDAAGLAYPDENWTWDDVVNAGKALTTDANGKHPGDAGFDSNNVVTWGIETRFWPVNWFPILWSYGGRVLTDDKSGVMFGDPADVDAMTWYGNLVQVEKIAPPYGYFGDADWDTAFGNGKTAMHILDSNIVANLKLQFPGLNYGTTLMPTKTVGGDRYVYMFGRAFGITSASKQKEAAWQFLRYLASPEMQAQYATGGRGLPASTRARETFLAGLDSETQTTMGPYISELPYIFTNDRADNFWTAIAMPLMNAIQKATTIDPSGTLPDYQALMDQAVSEAMVTYGSPVR